MGSDLRCLPIEQERYGQGHTLTVACSVGRDSDAAGLEALVCSRVAGAAVLRRAGGEVAFRLPSEASGAFPGLLDALERQGARRQHTPAPA